MSQIISFEEARRGTSVIKVELNSGEVYNIGFLSSMPLKLEGEYHRILSKILDIYDEKEDGDLLTFISCKIAMKKLETPLYIMPDKNDERIRIGKRIKELRDIRRMEAKKLAQVTEIDAANLCRIEQGRYSAGLDILCKIATALDARVELIQKGLFSSNDPFRKRVWLVPFDCDLFNWCGCLQQFQYCYWKQEADFSIGDIVLVIDTKGKKINYFSFVVSDVNIRYNDQVAAVDEFWLNKDYVEEMKNHDCYAKFLYNKTPFEHREETLDNIVAHGFLKRMPETPVKISWDFVNFLIEEDPYRYKKLGY